MRLWTGLPLSGNGLGGGGGDTAGELALHVLRGALGTSVIAVLEIRQPLPHGWTF